MPNDLDDFDIRPPEGEEYIRPARSQGAVPEKRGWWPVALAGALLVLAAGGAFLFLTRPQPPKAAIQAPPPSRVTAAPSSPPVAATTAAPPPLPALDESDAFVRQMAAGLSANPEMARWLSRTALVRTLATVVANVAHGETPRKELAFLAPPQRFRAATGGTRVVADPQSYAAYDTFADAIASVDARGVATAYRALEPLFETAYRDLGFSDGFRAAVDAAIRDLLAVPVPTSAAELVPAPVGFRWADPELEALTSAQKQFLRTGPRNVRLVQSKLRELQAALTSTLPPVGNRPR